MENLKAERVREVADMIYRSRGLGREEIEKMIESVVEEDRLEAMERLIGERTARTMLAEDQKLFRLIVEELRMERTNIRIIEGWLARARQAGKVVR